MIGLSSCCDDNCQCQKYAEIMIQKIDSFESTHKRLPEDVLEIGLIEKLDSPAFYQKTGDTTYMIWYGLGLGSSMVYYSTTKTWREEG